MYRKSTGTSIIETGAALSLLLPVAMLLIYVVTEISYAYLLKSGLSQGARQAARDLAVQYGKDPQIAKSRFLQDTRVFQHVRLNSIINNNAQFDDPVFDTGAAPHTVHVYVRYKSGAYGLPTFPYPDPLKLSGRFEIISDSTYRLE